MASSVIRRTSTGVATDDSGYIKTCIEMLPRIFDPFTQVTVALNRSEGGIGIGLAMVAHLVRLHHGTVQVFSDGPGHGVDLQSAPEPQETRGILPNLRQCQQIASSNPPVVTTDLQAVMDAWPTLPEPLRAGILAMVKGAKR